MSGAVTKSPTLDEVRAYYNRTYKDRPDIAVIGATPVIPGWYPVIVSNWAIGENHPMRKHHPDLVSLGYNNILLIQDDMMTLRYC